MAFIDDVIETLAGRINNILAPFQPHVPPNYPNLAPVAGQIPATLIAPGHPLQYRVTTRLENKQSQVCIYSGKSETTNAYLNDTDPLPVPGQPGQYVFEVGRSVKNIIVEVWSYDRASRRLIQDRIRAGLGEIARQTEQDGTVTLFRYTHIIDFDDEQSDSIYIAQLNYMADHTILQIPQGGTSTSGYPISEVDAYLTAQNQPLGLVVRNKNQRGY